MKYKIIILLTLLLGLGACKKDRMEVDILIENGAVYNGVDSIPTMLTLGVVGDRIAYVGNGKRIDFSLGAQYRTEHNVCVYDYDHLTKRDLFFFHQSLLELLASFPICSSEALLVEVISLNLRKSSNR